VQWTRRRRPAIAGNGFSGSVGIVRGGVIAAGCPGIQCIMWEIETESSDRVDAGPQGRSVHKARLECDSFVRRRNCRLALVADRAEGAGGRVVNTGYFPVGRTAQLPRLRRGQSVRGRMACVLGVSWDSRRTKKRR